MSGNLTKVLLVEDNPVDGMAFHRFVKKEKLPYDHSRAGSVGEGKRVLQSQAYDVVVMDYSLRDGTAFDLFGYVPEAVPIVIVTGSGNEEVAVQAMKMGAADYLIKDPHGNWLKTLPITVNNAIRVRRAEQELKRSHEELEQRVQERTTELRTTNGKLEKEIEQRIRVENALKKSEERLSLAMEASRDGLWDWDISSGQTYCSPGYFEMLGLSSGEHAQHYTTWADLIHPDDRQSALEVKQDCIDGKTDEFSVEFRMLHRDGTWRWILGRCKCVGRDDEGKAKRLVGTHTDITERKTVQLALHETMEKYRDLFDNAILGIFRSTPEGTYREINKAFARIFGFDSADEMKECVTDISKLLYVNPEDRSAIKQSLETEGAVEGYEVQIRRRDGSFGWISINAKALEDTEGVYYEGTIEDISERQEALNQLRQSEERFRLAMESVQDGVWDWDMTTGDVYRSPSFYSMLGYEEREFPLAFEGWIDMLNPADKASIMNTLEEYIAGKLQDYEVEFRMFHKSDELLWVLSRGEIVARDEDGKPLRMIGTHTDITERKKAQQKLERSEALLKEAQRVARIGHWELDDPAGTPTWSDEIFRIFGLDPAQGEPSFEAHRDIIHEEDWELLDRSVQDLSVKGIPFDIEFRLLRSDGSIRWMNTKGYPTRNAEGDVVRLFGTAQDISDRKRIELDLADQISFMESLIEAIPAPVFFKDINHVYLGCNISFADFIGRKKDEIIGKSVFEVSSKELANMYHAQDEALFNNPEPQIYESSVKNADGLMRDVVFHKAAFWDPSGSVAGLIGVILDITERKRAENERQGLQRQLTQAQKWEALGTLTGGIAHDFNNLLTIINGYTEVLLSAKSEDDPEYSDLQKILETGLKGAELVQKLSSFSKKDEGSLQALNLNRVLESSVALMERTFPKMIEIKTNLPEDLSTVNADASQLEQVLMNLCVNAKEAMPDGGLLRIKTENVFVDEDYCRLHPGTKPGPHVLVEISDTGMGMNKETIERIFDPFFSTKGWDFRKGTGLGLSVTKGIVEQHGGWITCKSEPGEGTTFRVYFPALDEKPQAVQMPIEARQSPQDGTILLVDDEELVGALGKRILERAGYDVITASNGKKALEVYSSEHPSIALVILDLIMPEMGGQECLEELIKINPHVRVVFSTGNPLSQNERDRLGMHAGGFVDKPYQVQRLLEVVRGILGAK
jgi:two-component system cell cycle sensor histidine kinase/response regulator CckA